MEPGDVLDQAYWRRQAREAAAFDRCLEPLADRGVRVVVEIRPASRAGTDGGSVLAAVGRRHPRAGCTVEPAAGLAGGPPIREGGCGRLRGGAGDFLCGVVRRGEPAAGSSLPSYPFQRRRHWIETPRENHFKSRSVKQKVERMGLT